MFAGLFSCLLLMHDHSSPHANICQIYENVDQWLKRNTLTATGTQMGPIEAHITGCQAVKCHI